VKSRATLSASSYELFWISGEINSEAKRWNLSQSVNLLTGSERFLLLMWSSKWKIIGRWSECRMSETMTSDSRTSLCTAISSTSPFPVGEQSKSKLHCDWQLVNQSVLVSSTIWVSWPDICYSLTVTVSFFVGRPLWREDGSLFCICCWPSPAESLSSPTPLGLVTVFYCHRFETSLFVASYDSQGHSGGIRPPPPQG
jgi:hypothetical protein